MPIGTMQFPVLSPEQANPLGAGLMQGIAAHLQRMQANQAQQQAMKMQQEMPYVAGTAREAMLKQHLANTMEQARSQYAQPLAQAELQKAQAEPAEMNARTGYYGAETNKMNTMTPLEAIKQHIENQYLGRLKESEINSNNSMANLRNMGGSGGGTGQKEEMFFQNLVGKDNPQLANDPVKLYEASNVLRQGGNKLADGTQLNPLSPASRSAFDRLTKGGTTANLLNQAIGANQAEAEMQVISKYAQEGLKPYGTTYFNKSPEQIMDTFKTDSTSQKKLGRFIAAQQLQNEIAQEETKLAQGQPGITNTLELMSLGQQLIDAKFPRLSAEARLEAQQYFMDALKEGFKARKQVGTHASQVEAGTESVTKQLGENMQKKADPLGIL